jgi:hypothetical protein
MDRGKRLAVLLKIRNGLQEALRSADAERRSELLSRLAAIQHEIDALDRSIGQNPISE